MTHPADLGSINLRPSAIAAPPPTLLDAEARAFGPPELAKLLSECRDARLNVRIAVGERHQHAHTPQALAPLRACRERPRGRAAEQRDERAPVHVWMAPAWQEKM